MTSDDFNRSFSDFAGARLRPVIDSVGAGKRRSLKEALLAATGVFALLAGAAYLVMKPFQETLRQHVDMAIWPLVLLAPVSVAMIAFCLVYLLRLRGTVRDFHAALFRNIAQFIDPGLVHGTTAPGDANETADSLLFAGTAQPVTGEDCFRGRVGGAAVLLRELRLPSAGEEAALSGVFLSARFDKAFREPLFLFPSSLEVSRQGLEDGLLRAGSAVAGGLVRLDGKTLPGQALRGSMAEGWEDIFLTRGVRDGIARLRLEDGTEVRLAVRGRVLYAALLARSATPEPTPGSFDFVNCRPFCRKATAALRLAGEVTASQDVWQA